MILNRNGRIFNTLPGFKPFVEAKKGVDSTEILVYDEISDWGINAAMFAEILSGIEGHVTVRINSPGGIAHDGIAIYNLMRERGNIDTVVDGIAASAASIIAMGGDSLPVMPEGSIMMIHKAWGVFGGNAKEMAKQVQVLETYDKSLASIYETRTGQPAETIEAMLDAETWFDAKTAIEAGFARDKEGTKSVSNGFDLSLFSQAPEQIENKNEEDDFYELAQMTLALGALTLKLRS